MLRPRLVSSSPNSAVPQKRRYEKRRRAELEAQTRRRITESAVALHSSVGPARTTMSALAEHAGVTRSTLYRHFPDEAAVLAACSAHWDAANPPPDLRAWAAIEDPATRLRTALTELLGFYARTGGMLTNLFRDEAAVPFLREALAGFRQGYLATAVDVLLEQRPERGRARERARALLGHALAFSTWKSLVEEQGLTTEEAVEVLARLAGPA